MSYSVKETAAKFIDLEISRVDYRWRTKLRIQGQIVTKEHRDGAINALERVRSQIMELSE